MKLLAQYLSNKKSKASLRQQQLQLPPALANAGRSVILQDDVLATLADWLADSACNRNSMVLLVAGMIHAHEGNYPEALKACHGSNSLEL